MLAEAGAPVHTSTTPPRSQNCKAKCISGPFGWLRPWVVVAGAGGAKTLGHSGLLRFCLSVVEAKVSFREKTREVPADCALWSSGQCMTFHIVSVQRYHVLT